MNAISINRQDKNAKIPASLGAWLGVLLLFNMVTSAEATVVMIEGPSAGTNIVYMQDFSVLDPLNGTFLNGESQSVNVFFADNAFLVTPGYNSFTVDLFINQSGAIGTWPTNEYFVTGYLIDAAGNPLSPSVSFPDSGTIPAQVWRGWPFYLPDGTQYLPATKMFEAQFAAAPVYGNPAGYYINPIIFSGVHFDITYPLSPMNAVIGGRIVIANFDEPILSSPYPVPYSPYFESIPQPTLAFTGVVGPGSNLTGILNLQLSGTPEYPYILQSATNLAYPVWQSLMTNSADVNGNWNITVTNLHRLPKQFFRVVAWPGPGQQ